MWAIFKDIDQEISSHEFHIFIDLRTRVEMVEKLKSIKFSGYSSDTSNAYECLLKVALAWSALDRVMALTGRKDNFNITNAALSSAIKSGRFEKMINALKELKGTELSNKGLLNDLGQNKASTKLNRLAKAIRNSMFHGTLNPTKVGLVNASSKQQMLNSLAEAILDTCVSEFELWASAR
jgi:hypothetical protein